MSDGALVPMPVAALHLYNGTVTRQYEIGPTGQLFVVKAKTKAAGMKPATHEHFGFRVPASNGSHVAAASLV